MKITCWSFVLCLSHLLGGQSAQADLALEYQVQFVDSMGNDLSGPVTTGTEVFWRISADITGAPNSGTNFGIATLSVGLEDSFAETLTPGTVDSAFSGYDTLSGGVVIGSALQFIGVQQDNQLNGSTIGDGVDPGTFLLASGSFTVTQVGLHTLQALAPLGFDTSLYFTAAGQSDADAVEYDTITFGADTLQVNAVPEPASLAMMGLACLGAWRLRRRKKALPATSQAA